MDFQLDPKKIRGPAPGSFEANILRSITVPFQEIVTSGGQYPLPSHPVSRPSHGPTIVIELQGLSEPPRFANGFGPLPRKDG